MPHEIKHKHICRCHCSRPSNDNPQWALASIKVLDARVHISTSDYGESNPGIADVCTAGITAHINREEALYTDADVLFYQEFDPCKLDLPEVMAIGPETERTANSWSELNWNAGVLFINLKGFAAVLPHMVQWANTQRWDFKAADQTLLNDYFPAVYGQSLSSLPEIYNWKGYWGSSPNKVRHLAFCVTLCSYV